MILSFRRVHLMRKLSLLVLVLVGCASSPSPNTGGCSHSHDLPPLKLGSDRLALLESVSVQPQSALDYYMLLPERYFSILPSDPQRRISFVDLEPLTKDYLSARHWFECDGGGFEVAIRVFRRPEGDLIAIDSSEDPSLFLFRRDEKLSGLNSVTVKKPTFWHYKDGWIPVDPDILPSLGLTGILDQYKNKYKADQVYPDQSKFIYLDYRLLPEGNTIPVVGRENFMDAAPTWAEYTFTGSLFKKK